MLINFTNLPDIHESFAVTRLLHIYIKFSDRITEWVGRSVSWLTLVLVLLICYDVVMRYIFNKSSIAIYELEWHIFALIFLLGAAFCFKHDRHVRVDVFYSRFSKKGQAWVNLIGTLLLLLPFCVVLLLSGWDFLSNSFRFLESSSDAGGLPARYIIKSAIPLGFLFVTLQAINTICKSLLVLTNVPSNSLDFD